MPARGPLRAVLVYDSHGRHVLECGHTRDFRYTAYGPTFPARAHCHGCRDGEPVTYTPTALAALVREVVQREQAKRRT
jgi:hypothetical protein